MRKEVLLNLQTEKHKFRRTLLDHRLSISSERRRAASNDAFKTLSKDLFQYNRILSFAPLPKEIDLWPLNQWLSENRKLYLPKVEEDRLLIFPITNLKTQLTRQSFEILEPNLDPSKSVSPVEIDCILVPGLGFDSRGHRLGYGKGFYDRLLLNLELAAKYGISLKEQTIQKCPTEDHDISVDRVYFF